MIVCWNCEGRAIFCGHLAQHSIIAGQSDERRIELVQESLDHIRLISFAVDADKDEFDFARIGSQDLLDPGEIAESRRAYVRTIRVAEEQQDRFAAKRLQPHRLVILVGQRPIVYLERWIDGGNPCLTARGRIR